MPIKNKIPLPASYGLTSKVHLPNPNPGHVYMPLCAKPSFLAWLDQYPDLLAETLIHCLDSLTGDQNILIFIADGAVMEEAFKAMDRSSRAHRITSSVAAQIKAKVGPRYFLELIVFGNL